MVADPLMDLYCSATRLPSTPGPTMARSTIWRGVGTWILAEIFLVTPVALHSSLLSHMFRRWVGHSFKLEKLRGLQACFKVHSTGVLCWVIYFDCSPFALFCGEFEIQRLCNTGCYHTQSTHQRGQELAKSWCSLAHKSSQESEQQIELRTVRAGCLLSACGVHMSLPVYELPSEDDIYFACMSVGSLLTSSHFNILWMIGKM